jgi:hypothetical protein
MTICSCGDEAVVDADRLECAKASAVKVLTRNLVERKYVPGDYASCTYVCLLPL